MKFIFTVSGSSVCRSALVMSLGCSQKNKEMNHILCRHHCKITPGPLTSLYFPSRGSQSLQRPQWACFGHRLSHRAALQESNLCTALFLPVYGGSSCSWAVSAPLPGQGPGRAPRSTRRRGESVPGRVAQCRQTSRTCPASGCLCICSFPRSWKLKQAGKKRQKEKLEITKHLTLQIPPTCGSRGLESMLCIGPFRYDFGTHPTQCGRAVGGRRSVTIWLDLQGDGLGWCSANHLQHQLFVPQRLWLEGRAWGCSGQQDLREPARGTRCQKKVQRGDVSLSLLPGWIKH